MGGFFSAFDDLVRRTGAREAHEIGCGEGHLSSRLAGLGLTVRACDFSTAIIDRASALHAGSGIDFHVRGIYDLDREEDSAPLVVCSEVLEHVEHPEAGLRHLADVTEDFCILSVPREPLWRLLNMARGKYLGNLGNTPGHLQHWSRNGFMGLVSNRFDIVECRSPVPWTMILCRVKRC